MSETPTPEQEMIRWRSAFQACTPGGSEFTSPESVRDYMQNMKRETVETKLERARLRQRVAELEAALRETREACHTVMELNECEVDTGHSGDFAAVASYWRGVVDRIDKLLSKGE